MIIDLLSAADIKSVRLANSNLAHTAKYGLHRKIKVELPRDDFSQVQARFSTLQTEGLLPSVRRFEVSGLHNRAPEYPLQINGDKYIKLICWCLPQMSGLKEFVLHGLDIPAEVLTVLQTRPEVGLAIHAVGLATYSSFMEKPKQLFALKHNQQLHSLEVRHIYVTAEECLAVTKPLREILLTCPNIRKLKLDIGMPTKQRIRPIPTEYHGMGFRNGERLPPLKDLEIVNYPFGFSRDDALHNFEDYPEKIDEDLYWIQTFDWSRLRQLRAPMCRFMIKIMPMLCSLKRLCFTAPEVVLPRSAELPVSVESIEIDSVYCITRESFIKLGSSLQRLRIHHTKQRTGQPCWNVSAILDSRLRELRHHCPDISSFALDIARDGEWPYKTLDTLASFPRLRTLELWFELGVKVPENPVKPYVTFAAVARHFKYLYDRNLRLRKLIVHSGAPAEVNWIGLSVRDSFWPKQNTATFECQLAAVEDKASQGIFASCTNLASHDNCMLRRMLATYPDGDISFAEAMEGIGEDWHALDAGRMRACKVAWEGPAELVPSDFDMFAAPMSLPLSDYDEADE